MRQIAIIGLSPTTHDDAPWSDQAWEKWGLPWDGYWARCDRLFEMHQGYDPAYDVSRVQIIETITQDNFPLADAVALGGDLFACSISYMLALAILEGAERIGIWGVTGDENYTIQRPNINYWIGIARGRGICVDVADESLQCCGTDIYPVRYGVPK